MIWMLSLFAFAGSPDLSKLDAAGYNDYLVLEGVALVNEMNQRIRAIEDTGDLKSAEAIRLASLKVIRSRLQRMKGLPGFKGDTGLRDACIDGLEHVEQVFDEELAVFYTTIYDPDPTNAELAEAGKAWLKIESMADASDDVLVEAQKVFAKENRLQIVERGEQPVLDQRAFETDNLPPEGVDLNLGAFMVMTVGYTNAHVEVGNGLVEALNAAMGVDPNEDPTALNAPIAAAKKQVSTARKQLDGLEKDWVGRTQLHTAMEEVVAVSDRAVGLFEEYATLWQKKPRKRTNKDIDRINAIAAELDTSINGVFAQFNAATTTWDGLFQIQAYGAWSEAELKRRNALKDQAAE